MHALVTGATGFVGSHLVDELLARKWTVSATVRSTSKLKWLEGKPLNLVKADLSDPASLKNAVGDADTVIHVAGLLRGDTPAQYRAGNWGTTRNLLGATPKDRRFLFVSSLASAGPSPDATPLHEDQPCVPISLYGKSKNEAERAVWDERDSRSVTIVRPPAVYGTRDEGLLELYQTLARGINLEFGGTKYVSLVHVRDLAKGIADAAGPAGAGHIFYLSNPKPYKYGDLMDSILRALKKRAIKVPIPDRVARLLGGIVEDTTKVLGLGGLFTRDKALEMTQKYWTCSPAKAKRLLNWETTIDVDAGFQETIDWYRKEKLL